MHSRLHRKMHRRVFSGSYSPLLRLAFALASLALALGGCTSLPEQTDSGTLLILPVMTEKNATRDWGGRYELQLTSYSLADASWEPLPNRIVVDLYSDDLQLVESVPAGSYIITGIVRYTGPTLRTTIGYSDTTVISAPFRLESGRATLLSEVLYITERERGSMLEASFEFRRLTAEQQQEFENDLDLTAQSRWRYERGLLR